MCHELFHRCLYCSLDYVCFEEDVLCPTINEDLNRNLCPLCNIKLEERIATTNQTNEELDLEDLLGEDND